MSTVRFHFRRDGTLFLLKFYTYGLIPFALGKNEEFFSVILTFFAADQHSVPQSEALIDMIPTYLKLKIKKL